jgi:mono/diheme cytochrome c family protein
MNVQDTGGATWAKMMDARFSRAIAACVLLLLTVRIPALTQNAQSRNSGHAAKTTGQPAENQLVRGKYIVEGLCRCAQCHTPRDEKGNFDRSHWLEGAPVWLKSAEPVADWPLQAPRIAGIPPGTDAEMLTLLTTGIWRDGKPLRQPMPQFRMTQPDAEAVVAYLKSVKSRSN